MTTVLTCGAPQHDEMGCTCWRPDGDSALMRAFATYQRRRDFSEKTITCRTSALRSLARHLDGRGLLQATRADIESWLGAGDLGPQAVYSYTAHLHAFYRFAVRDGFTTSDPTVHIDRPKLPKRLPRPMCPDDLTLALSESDTRMRAWICLGAYQGFRIGDMAGLRREDVLDSDRPPMIRVIQGKGKKDRCLPLNPKTLAALVAFGLPAGGPVFTGKNGAALSASAVGIYIGVFFDRLGITATPHALRHTFGSNVYGRSRDLLLTQQLMGHGSVQTTMGYVALNPDDAAVDVVRGLGDEPLK